ncbi:MAG: right-handed parallel beta-helix repeat-containing protein [Planctomycetota bacterium]|jgi:parallel beta-helix repeat protein
MTNCTFSSNTADTDAGGMYNNNNSSPTVTNCSFTGNSAVYSGGGMYNYSNSSPTVADCTFSQNMANTAGGMVNVDGSSPEVTNCNFTGNTAASDVWGGAGMCNLVNSSPMVINCTFTDNTATYDGGGMSNYDNSNPTVTNCNLTGNSADKGGGMYNYNDSSPTVTICDFSGNTASSSGGGMCNNGSEPNVTNCTFTGNESQAGGGMLNEGGSSPCVTNCIFSGNSAGWGAGMWNYGSNPTLTNCTFSDNAGGTGGGMYNEAGSNPAVTNCILWGNTSNEIVDVDSAANVSYSDVQGGWGGAGNNNINADPCFVAPGYWGDVNDTNTPVEPNDPNAVWVDGDYHLLAGSPCIDTGDNNSVPPDTSDLDGDSNTTEPIPWDLDGNPRFVDGDSDGNSVVDMGAYERRDPIYVDMDAPGPVHDGTSWANAYKYLQDALAEANSLGLPIQIWVAQGIYTPDTNSADPNGSGDRAATFQLISAVTINGGYAGFGEPNSNARDFNQYEAVLSGDLDGNDVDVNDPYDLFTEPNRAENSYHVVTGSGTDETATLDGFTIIAGNADGPEQDHQNCGAGMYNASSSPTATNCVFVENSAVFGGGMYNGDSGPTLINCSFKSNAAGNAGGGMYSIDANSPVLINCIFSGNLTISEGGGIAHYSDNPTTLTNCIFTGNFAVTSGAGMLNEGGPLELINCTFSQNSALVQGGGFCHWGGNSTLTNCILWDNAAPEGAQIYDDGFSPPTVSYCDIQGGWPGDENIDEDPRFVDANGPDNVAGTDDDNLRLLFGSPCVDAGDNNSLPADIYDLDGDGNTTEPIPFDLDANSRILDGNNDGYMVVDMGAYETEAPPIVDVPMKFTPQALNPCSKGKVYAHFVWPQGSVEGQVTDTPATLRLLGTEVVSEYTKVVADAHGLVRVKIAFSRAALCGVTTDRKYAEVIVTGTLSSGHQFRGTDTVKIND